MLETWLDGSIQNAEGDFYGYFMCDCSRNEGLSVYKELFNLFNLHLKGLESVQIELPLLLLLAFATGLLTKQLFMNSWKLLVVKGMHA